MTHTETQNKGNLGKQGEKRWTGLGVFGKMVQSHGFLRACGGGGDSKNTFPLPPPKVPTREKLEHFLQGSWFRLVRAMKKSCSWDKDTVPVSLPCSSEIITLIITVKMGRKKPRPKIMSNLLIPHRNLLIFLN